MGVFSLWKSIKRHTYNVCTLLFIHSTLLLESLFKRVEALASKVKKRPCITK